MSVMLTPSFRSRIFHPQAQPEVQALFPPCLLVGSVSSRLPSHCTHQDSDAFFQALKTSRASFSIVCLFFEKSLSRLLLLLFLPSIFRGRVGVARQARGEWTKIAAEDELMTNVLAELAVPWFFSCHLNLMPIAVIASVLYCLAYFLNLFFQ